MQTGSGVRANDSFQLNNMLHQRFIEHDVYNQQRKDEEMWDKRYMETKMEKSEQSIILQRKMTRTIDSEQSDYKVSLNQQTI